MKHKLTRLTSLLLAFIMTFSMLLVPVEAVEFSDVPDGSWFADAVDYVYEKGWMVGVGDSTFAPNLEVTRGMFVTVLAKYAQADLSAVEPAFTDTPAGAWYTGPCAWAAEKGITAGAGDGLFLPNRSITRQDLVTILYRFIEKMGYSIPTGAAVSFNDMDQASAYAVDAVNFCAAAGLVAGVGDGGFHPLDTATRSQLAVILMKLDSLVTGTQLPTDPRPAQDFGGEAGNDLTVTVNAPEGALPENSGMTVERVTDEDVLSSIRDQFLNAEILAAADISFTNADGEEIEPEVAVEVQIEMEGLGSVQNPVVVHVKDDGTVELVGAQLVSVNRAGTQKALRFYANAFSVYAILEGTPTPKLTTMTVHFHAKINGVDQVINVQKLRKKDIDERESPFYDPGVPGILPTQTFEGWTMNSNPDAEMGNAGYDVEGLNAAVKTMTSMIEPGTNLDIHLYAKVYNVVYVIYHDQAGAVQATTFHYLPSGASSVSVTIHYDYVPFKDNQQFSGWVTEQYVDLDKLGDYPVYQQGAANNVIQDGAPRPVSATMELYPYVEEGYWLSFNNNIAKNNEANAFDDDTPAVYISPKFYAHDARTSQPSFGVASGKERPGYTFAGWYLDPDMRTQYTFNQQLTEDTTLYAKWTKASTKYHVIFWQQKSSDEVDAATKTYDYYKSEERSAATGSSVQITTSNSGTSADNRRGGNSSNSIGEMGYYFQYDATASDTGSVQVKGDGSTVLNVYYDRKTITINFYSGFDVGSTPTTVLAGWYYYRPSNYSTTVYLVEVFNSGGTLYFNYNGTSYRASTYRTSLYIATPSGVTTRRGLYEHAYSNWPSPGNNKRWFHIEQQSNGAWVDNYSMSISADAYKIWRITSDLDPLTLTWDLVSMDFSQTNPKRLSIIGQDTDGDWTVDLGSSLLGPNSTLTMTNELFTGYKMYATVVSGTTYSIPDTLSQVVYGYSDDQSGIDIAIPTGGASIYYARNRYTLNYISGADTVRTESVFYQKALNSYAKDPNDASKDYVPSNGPAGSYFAGWYADPQFSRPFNFSSSMPLSNVVVYAKWIPKWYRIIFDMNPVGDPNYDPNAVIRIPGTTQDTTFVIEYGNQVQTSALAAAQREGYLLLGFYLDPNYKNHFNPEDLAPFGIDDESYAVAPDSERQGDDPISGKHWSDVGYPDVKGKITLYAKWRKDPEGAIGLNIEYLADNGADTGHFANDENVWHDPNTYADLAQAYGQPASVPDIEGEQFLYWEVLDAEDVVKERVYPGQTFTTHLDYAVEERRTLPDPNAQSGNVAPDPTRGAPNPVTVSAEAWEETNAFEDGGEYLFGYESNGTVYLMMNYNPAANAYYGSSSISGYTANRVCYAIPAILDSRGRVTGVDTTDFSGATLEHVRWKAIYETQTNGYRLQSQHNTSRYLRPTTDDPDVTTNLNLYPATLSNEFSLYWHWDSDNHYLYYYAGPSYSTLYVSTIRNNADVVRYFDSDVDASYAKSLKLYKLAPTTYTLTVRYQLENGSPVPDGNGGYLQDYVQDELLAGASYSVASPTVPGYDADPLTVAGAMPADDLTLTVTYYPQAISSEEWEPTTSIEPGEDYLIAYMVDGQPYLMVNYNESASNHYYLSQSYTGGEVWLGYLAPATVDSNTGYVVGVSGNATDLNNCKWIFSSSTGGTITSARDSRYGLYFDRNGVFPYTSKDTWTWTVTNQANQLGRMNSTYNGTNYYFALLTVVNGTPSYWSSGNPPYAGYASNSNYFANVRLYKRHVSAETTWNVYFVDEAGNTLASTQTIANNTAIDRIPTPQREDYYFLGWYEAGSSEKFNFSRPITEDTVLVGKFMYMYENVYTVRLRAVYGMRNTTGTTHIFWYANDGTNSAPLYHGPGAGDRFSYQTVDGQGHVEEGELEMYQPQLIPYPTVASTPENQITWIGTNASESGLDYEGHRFLGWGRVDATGAGGMGIHQYQLVETDLFFEYKENDQGKGYYIYHNTDNPNDPDNGKIAIGVYADEDTPYHDFYAIWSKNPFYVFHSATGRIDRIDLDRVMDYYDGVYDLTEAVTPGYLYGGYYVDSNDNGVYGTLSKAQMENLINNGTWTLNSDPDSPILATHTINVTTPNELPSFRTYDGALYTNGSSTPYVVTGTNPETGKPTYEMDPENPSRPKLYPLSWDKNDAATAERGFKAGDQMEPEGGMVYYLKEVPSSYLTSKVLFTYDLQQENKIVDLWLLSLTDDSNYNNVGFQHAPGKSAEAVNAATPVAREALTRTFTLLQRKPDGNHVTIKVEAKDFGCKEGCGLVAVKHLASLTNDGNPDFTMLPYWTTPDGVTVHNNGLHWNKVNNTDPSAVPRLTWQRVFDGTEKLYVNTDTRTYGTGGDRFNWRDDNAVIEIMFANASTSHILVLQETEIPNLSEVTVPAGEWTKVLICRMSQEEYDTYTSNPDMDPIHYFPSGQGVWNTTGDVWMLQGYDDNSFPHSHDNYLKLYKPDQSVKEWGVYPDLTSASSGN